MRENTLTSTTWGTRLTLVPSRYDFFVKILLTSTFSRGTWSISVPNLCNSPHVITSILLGEHRLNSVPGYWLLSGLGDCVRGRVAPVQPTDPNEVRWIPWSGRVFRWFLPSTCSKVDYRNYSNEWSSYAGRWSAQSIGSRISPIFQLELWLWHCNKGPWAELPIMLTVFERVHNLNFPLWHISCFFESIHFWNSTLYSANKHGVPTLHVC